MPCCPCDLATVLVGCLEWCLAAEDDEPWVLEDCNCFGFGLLAVVVVAAKAAPATSSDRQNAPANWKLRFPLSNNHLYDKSMNFRITGYCNQALAKRKQKSDPSSQNGTIAALGKAARGNNLLFPAPRKSRSLDSRPPDPKRVGQERRALARDDNSNS